MRKVYLNRLAKLANYLETEVKDEDFDIRHYRVDGKDYFMLKQGLKHKCGTVGCAIGHVPFAFRINFNNYTSFKGISSAFLGVAHWSDAFKYMFHYEWVYNQRQKTRKATIERIRKFVEVKGELTPQMRRMIKNNNIG